MDKIKNIAQDVVNGSWQLQAAAGIFIAVMLLLLITIVYQIVDVSRLDHLTDPQSARAADAAALQQQNRVASVVGSPIFGSYVDQKIEKVNTTLRLLGIMSTDQSDLRRAFIAEPDQIALVYQEGDEISKGLKVHRIYTDKVTLLRYGKRETLYIAWDQINGEVRKRPRAVTRATIKKSRWRARPSFNREEYMEKIQERLKERGIDGSRGFRGLINKY